MRRTGNLNDWNRSTGGQGGWRRPLTPGVKYLMIFTGVAYLGQVYALKQGLIDPWFLALVPERIIQGAVWQFITALIAYAISPDATSNLVSLIFGLLGFYFVGTLLEGTWGTRRFLWYYVRAGVATHLIAFLFMALIGQVHTRFPVSSATAVVFGTFLGSFGALFWEQQVNFNFVPLRGKTLVWIMTGVAIFMLLRGDFWWAGTLSGVWVGVAAVRKDQSRWYRTVTGEIQERIRLWRIRRKYRNFKVVDAEMKELWDDLEDRMNRDNQSKHIH